MGNTNQTNEYLNQIDILQELINEVDPEKKYYKNSQEQLDKLKEHITSDKVFSEEENPNKLKK